jgi:hypothetical protein
MTLQAVQRGRQVRDELSGRKAAQQESERRAAEQDGAATRLQALRRGQSARRGVAADEAEARQQRDEAARREKAVVRIGAVARGGLAREGVARDRKGGDEVVARSRVQAFHRRAEALRRCAAAAGMINRVGRGRASRRAVGNQREAAAAAAAEAAAAAAAAEAKQQADAASLIGAKVRGDCVRREARARDRAAHTIQARQRSLTAEQSSEVQLEMHLARLTLHADPVMQDLLRRLLWDRFWPCFGCFCAACERAAGRPGARRLPAPAWAELCAVLLPHRARAALGDEAVERLLWRGASASASA